MESKMPDCVKKGQSSTVRTGWTISGFCGGEGGTGRRLPGRGREGCGSARIVGPWLPPGSSSSWSDAKLTPDASMEAGVVVAASEGIRRRLGLTFSVTLSGARTRELDKDEETVSLLLARELEANDECE